METSGLVSLFSWLELYLLRHINSVPESNIFEIHMLEKEITLLTLVFVYTQNTLKKCTWIQKHTPTPPPTHTHPWKKWNNSRFSVWGDNIKGEASKYFPNRNDLQISLSTSSFSGFFSLHKCYSFPTITFIFFSFWMKT